MHNRVTLYINHHSFAHTYGMLLVVCQCIQLRMYVYFTTIMHFHLITISMHHICLYFYYQLPGSYPICAVTICLYNDCMQYKNKVFCCNPYVCMTFASISVYSILSHTPIYTPFSTAVLLCICCIYVYVGFQF